jgi:hypothetical protein
VNFSFPALLAVAVRKAQLEALMALCTENHDELCDAHWKDLRRLCAILVPSPTSLAVLAMPVPCTRS